MGAEIVIEPWAFFLALATGLFVGAYVARSFYSTQCGSITVLAMPEVTDDAPRWVRVTCPDGWEFQGPEDAAFHEDIRSILREHGVELIGRKA